MSDFYRPQTLLEINEMSMENLMKGPYVTIREDRRRVVGSRMAEFNAAGLEKYGSLIAEHRCDALGINHEGVANGEIIEFLAPNFAGLAGTERIEYLRISGNGAFAPDFDMGQLDAFANVRCLETDSLRVAPDLADFFPKLETWINLDWRQNRIEPLNGRWPQFRHLHVDRFQGGFDAFAGADLMKLFLIRALIPSLDAVLRFGTLKMLRLTDYRRAYDISRWSALQGLELLRVENCPKLVGWEAFRSERLRALWATRLPSADILEQFPMLERYSIDELSDSGQNYLTNVEPDDDPFTAIVESHDVEV